MAAGTNHPLLCPLSPVARGRYRKAPITRADPYLRGLDSTATEHDPDINERLGGGGPCALQADEQCDFDEASGEHRATVELPGQFIGHLIGKGGSKLKQVHVLYSSTRTDVLYFVLH